MADEKGIRLSAVVKDLNIGLDHLVEFLSKKGFSVDKKPTTKITAEAYDLLQKEFASDKQIKQVAQEITKEKQRKENIVIEAKQTISVSREKEPEPDDVLQKSLLHIKQEAFDKLNKTSVKEKDKTKKEEKPAEPEVIKAKADKIETPKVLGKISLEETKPAKGEKKTNSTV